MLKLTYSALNDFKEVFRCKSTWLIFCVVVLGFMGSGDMIGVTSFCRFWGFDEKIYHSLLHFFRSTGWSINEVVIRWGAFVLSQNETILVDGRAVLIGDHTFAPKDGCRMPGVVSVHQTSETQSKPSYFRGHCWGAIGLLVGSMVNPFCLPLVLAIHQGFVHIGVESKSEGKRATMGTRTIQMALDFAIRHDRPCVMILDAFFPSWPVFGLAASVWSIRLKGHLLTLIVRAKKNYVAYFEPDEANQKPRGRKRKYGEKVKLMEIFDHTNRFLEESCQIYGRKENVSIAALDLLWKPAGGLIRFVFAATSRGNIVFMCSDLTMNPVTALELYCTRPRIECMFDMLKNMIGAFCYRFWSMKLPLHSRKPKKNSQLKSPVPENVFTVHRCWIACERFVMLGAIALGLFQLIALKFKDYVWDEYDGFLRTRSRSLPSERTVKYVFANTLKTNFRNLASDAILRKIRKRFFKRSCIKMSDS